VCGRLNSSLQTNTSAFRKIRIGTLGADANRTIAPGKWWLHGGMLERIVCLRICSSRATMSTTSVAIEHTIIRVFAVTRHLTSDRSRGLPSTFRVWPRCPSSLLLLGVKVLSFDEKTLALSATFCSKAHSLSGTCRDHGVSPDWPPLCIAKVVPKNGTRERSVLLRSGLEGGIDFSLIDSTCYSLAFEAEHQSARAHEGSALKQLR